MKKLLSKSFRPNILVLEDRLVPATFNVTTLADVVNPNDGQLSLREAITRANAAADSDTIQLQAGVYKISLAGSGENANATGDFDITNPVFIEGKGAADTIINGGGLDRLFEVFGAHGIRFSKLTLRNGATSGAGGAIQALTPGNIITLTECTVSGNKAGLAGGGINAETIFLITCTVSDNTGEQGGGISAFTTANVINSTVSGNKALAAGVLSRVGGDVSPVLGGGISAKTVNLSSSTVSGNKTAGPGGGIFATTVNMTFSTVSGNEAKSSGGVFAHTATVSDSTISGNTGWRYAGGISASELNMTRCTVSGNQTAGSAGGIAASGTLSNCTVSGNVAGMDGGGIAMGTGTILNCTIVKNRAGENGGNGGGLFASSGAVSPPLHVKNTIIAMNQVMPRPTGGSYGGFGPDVFAGSRNPYDPRNLVSDGHNLIGIGDDSFYVFTNGVKNDQVGTKAAPLDPRLGPLANNGGPTLTHAVLSRSPAINRGDSNGAPATDQRGVVRFAGFIDIGAFQRPRLLARTDLGTVVLTGL